MKGTYQRVGRDWRWGAIKLAMAVPMVAARLGLCSCQVGGHDRVNLAWHQGDAERFNVLALVGEHEYFASRWPVAKSCNHLKCSVSCNHCVQYSLSNHMFAK